MTGNSPLFRRASWAALCCAATVALGGCVAAMNGEPVVFEPAIRAKDGALPVSVTGLARDDWPLTTVSIPASRVAHQPTYAANFKVDPISPRRAGVYPTVDTAIEIGRDDGDARFEGFVAYPHVGLLFLKAPFEMIGGRWPWSIVSSGPEYQRTRGR